MRKTGRCALTAVLSLGLLAVLAGGAAAADSSPSERPLDPIVAQVIQMLNAGVSDNLILQWLDSTDRRPVDIGSQDLIALTEAEASEQLVTTLLELVEEGRVEEPTAGSAVVEPAETPPPSPSAAGASAVEAIFELSAKRVWVDEDEPDSPREERWHVFLYLDGEFIAWTRPTKQGEPVEARRVIGTGPKEIRVILQRYEERRAGWFYESLTVPSIIAFEAEAGGPIEVEVDMRRIWGAWRDRNQGGPLSYIIRQGTRVLAEQSGTGGNPSRWQPVCEDVEANFPDAEGVPKAFRNPMSRCVRWAELWNGPGKTTSRSEILRQLAENDFEPPVR